MNIKIQSLHLTNFKCFRDKEFHFGEDIVTIRGRNGAGKTTIADAILFCLFGKNTAGQSDLDLFKTLENGAIIPHLDHSVEMVLSVGDKDVTLQRTIKENWIKRRGSNETVFKNNTTEYFVDGEAYTAADYKKYIASLISEDVFRAITNPTYFPSLKWQDQRTFLEKLAGDVEVPVDNKEFVELLQYMNDHNEDIVAYRRHLSYKIKEIRKKLDLIPTRLEEQNKALPENLDWASLSSQYVTAQSQLKEIEEQILTVKQGNGSDLKRDEIRKQIDEVCRQMNDMETECFRKYNAQTAEKSKNVQELSAKFNEALNNQKLYEQSISAHEVMLKRAKEVDYEAELQKLRDQWPREEFTIDPQAAYCPTCGQPIPQDQYDEKVKEMQENFNAAKVAKAEELNARAAKIHKEREEAEAEIKRIEGELKTFTDQLEATKQAINDIFAAKSKAEKVHVPTVKETLATDAQYNDFTNRLQELRESLNNVSESPDNEKSLEVLNAKKCETIEQINLLNTQLATKSQYDRIISLIDGINEEEKNLVTQLSELERQEDVARQYQEQHNTVLQERINEHFKITRWRLFRTVNNGGDPFDEPYCECYSLDGVAYHEGLNQAARLNIGLDICNALCKHYEVSAPIIIDNAESTINIIETIGQQLRLQVFESELSLV